MSEDLFNEENKDAPVIDPDKDYFEEFVGEGKKYKDSKAAGRAILEKDLYIERLEKEGSEYRQEIQSRLSIEEALTKMNSESNTNSNAQATSQQEDGNTGANDSQGITPEAIDNLVEEKLKARELADQQRSIKEKEDSNLDLVRGKLSETYGPNFAAKVKERAEELGVSTQFLTDTGAREPKALFKLLDLDVETPRRDLADPAPQRSVVNTASMTNAGPTDRTQSYYDNLKKQNPSEYWTAKVQNQRHKDALRIGERFFDT